MREPRGAHTGASVTHEGQRIAPPEERVNVRVGLGHGGVGLNPDERAEGSVSNRWCLMLEAIPWDNPTYAIFGRLPETWRIAELGPALLSRGRDGIPSA